MQRRKRLQKCSTMDLKSFTVNLSHSSRIDSFRESKVLLRFSAVPGLSKMNPTLLHAEIVEVEIEIVSPSIVPSGNLAELNRTVTCMVLKAYDRRTSCPCHDEFRGPRSDYVRQVASENNNNNKSYENIQFTGMKFLSHHWNFKDFAKYVTYNIFISPVRTDV
ncbi:hypothetical protein TNCV_1348171 [Trichonephila clavipes]|nr:hypothetical protein TNCV_1348171 [Trichonephila clavipes]